MTFMWRDTDRGYDRMRELARSGDKSTVAVGVFSGPVRSDGSGMTNAQLYRIHEFGAPHATPPIPERSSLRSTLDRQRALYRRLARHLGGLVLTQAMSHAAALDTLGQRVVADVRRTIQRGIPPPNSAATIEAKSSSKPLIDTGRMIQAIDHEVRR